MLLYIYPTSNRWCDPFIFYVAKNVLFQNSLISASTLHIQELDLQIKIAYCKIRQLHLWLIFTISTDEARIREN